MAVKKKTTRKRKVLVTTDCNRQGVFSGILETGSVGGVVVLSHARMVVSWPSSSHGLLGLAANGPPKGSRISPEVPRIDLDGVTSITDITPNAWKLFEAEPWS